MIVKKPQKSSMIYFILAWLLRLDPEAKLLAYLAVF